MNFINQKQNETHMLRVQFAARHCFNQAEKHNYRVWIIVLLAQAIIFCPDSWPMLIEPSLAALFTIGEELHSCRRDKLTAQGASLRGYFDAYVLDIGHDDWSRTKKEELEKYALSLEKKFPEEARIQMSHTGCSNPPGVYNWYDVPKNFEKSEAVFECQKQNANWTKRLMNKRLASAVIEGVVLIAAILLAYMFYGDEWWTTVLFSVPLVLHIYKRVHANIKYFLISQKIGMILENLGEDRTEANTKHLQEQIDQRRELPVFERNCIHKKKAKKFSEEDAEVRISVMK